MITIPELLGKKSRHQTQALSGDELQEYLAALPEWELQGEKISRSFSFKNYYETLAFVNAIAYIIHAEDHHPDLAIGYSRCNVTFHTHSVNGGFGGLSENDFICAAKIDALHAQTQG